MPICSLKPNVTHEEAISQFTAQGATRLIRALTAGPLRSVAELYLPFRIFRARIVNRGKLEERLVAIDTAPAIVNEVTLVGSRCGRFEPALKMLASGKVRVCEMIAAEFPLDRAAEAFAGAAKKGTLKVLLRPPG